MADVIIWCVKIRIVRLISVGFALDLGNLMDPHGIIVIVTMKKRQKPHEMRKKSLVLHYRGICFIATAI
uniref:Putative secreted protein n=1 Tax=Panstrongylus lignarius TaxID=156445 RepID=A0A224XY91_9HEMI